MSIRLITFDLDDTLWHTAPIIQGAETALRDWLAVNAPCLGGFPIEALGAIRRMLVEREPSLRHRISELRRRILFHALSDAGYPDAVFFSTRVIRSSWPRRFCRPWSGSPTTLRLA